MVTANLYESWMIKGSYFGNMLHCGKTYNGWIQNALRYLPVNIFDEHKEKLAFICTGEVDACCVARELCENRELIILSERILPRKGENEESAKVRYFTFLILHEIAHAICKHRSPLFDNLTKKEAEAQELEADKLAFKWFNEYVDAKDNPCWQRITDEEIDKAKARNQNIMKTAYEEG